MKKRLWTIINSLLWPVIFVLIFIMLTHFIHVLPLFDYIEYWSAGKLNLTGNNPYGIKELYALQTQLGWTYKEPLLSWNPPWTQVFLIPLALLPYDMSRTLWLMFSIAIVLFSAQQIWSLYSGPPEKGLIALIVAITFSPVFFNLFFGQITPLILLGIIGFWKMVDIDKVNWKKDILTGFFISLAMIKPQLLYLFIIAILIWSITRKNWGIPFGFSLSLILETTIASFFNPGLVSQYLSAVLNYPPTNWATPTIGYYLRLLFGFNHFWLQFIPNIFGLVWFFHYWQKHKHAWVWKKELPLIILISIITSSYTWIHDQIVLVPALIIVLTRFLQNPRYKPRIFIGISYVFINIFYLVMHFRWDDSIFIWMGIAFLVLYLSIPQYERMGDFC